MKSVIKTLLIASFCLVSCNNEDVNSLKEQNDKLQKQMDELVAAQETKEEEVATPEETPETVIAAQETKEEVSLSPYLKYEIEGDAVTITFCQRFAPGVLIIPAVIEDKPVTSIGDQAFYSCTRLTSITIPDSVTSIGKGAFYKCTGLTSITIGNGVTTYGDGAFSACTSLTTVTFLGDAPKIEDEFVVFPFNGSSPTIYREADAKGWGDTLAGRPVKLITEKR